MEDAAVDQEEAATQKVNHKFSRTENCTSVAIALEKGKFKSSRRVCTYLGWLPDADPTQALAKRKIEHEDKVQTMCKQILEAIFVGKKEKQDKYDTGVRPFGPFDGYCELERPIINSKGAGTLTSIGAPESQWCERQQTYDTCITTRKKLGDPRLMAEQCRRMQGKCQFIL